jgi:hypothetical protein
MTTDDAGTVRRGHDTDGDVAAPARAVTAHRSCPDRTVFTEEGNTDAWISTDTVVNPER